MSTAVLNRSDESISTIAHPIPMSIDTWAFYFQPLSPCSKSYIRELRCILTDMSSDQTVELVFRRPNISNDLLPSVMTNVRRVGAAKLLGVHLTQNLTFSQHIDVVVTLCNQRLYLLAQPKRQGLDLSALDSCFLRYYCQ